MFKLWSIGRSWVCNFGSRRKVTYPNEIISCIFNVAAKRLVVSLWVSLECLVGGEERGRTPSRDRFGRHNHQICDYRSHQWLWYHFEGESSLAISEKEATDFILDADRSFDGSPVVGALPQSASIGRRRAFSFVGVGRSHGAQDANGVAKTEFARSVRHRSATGEVWAGEVVCEPIVFFLRPWQTTSHG